MNRIHPKPWDDCKPIGKFASISQAARELRMTRQAVKAMFRHVDQFETVQPVRNPANREARA